MSDSRPNIIFIMTDQQRGDCLSIDGHPALLTPNMDHLAHSGGARFTRAYSTCPSCIPARRSLMTGQFPATHGMVGFRPNVEWDAPPTLPGVLAEAGYQTAHIGRDMHLYPERKGYGFQEMVINADYHQYVKKHVGHLGLDERAHGVSGNGWVARPWHLDEALHPTTWTVTEMIRFLERRDTDHPFFATCSFWAPHPPLTPPAFYLDRYLGMDLPPLNIGDWATPPANGGLGLHPDSDTVDLRGEALRHCHAGYYGLINHVDDQIGRLIDAIARRFREIRQNTVFIFTADHGEMLGDHHLFRKCYPYDASARIPFLITGPGIEPQTIHDHPVCLEDLMPTILDLAGVNIPDTVDGRSLVPVLRGASDEPMREYLHGEHAICYRPEQANHYLVDDRWKYIWYTQTGVEQLFDLKNDPNEMINLADDPAHGDELTRWRTRLIDKIKDRPEAFTDGENLVCGQPHTALLAHAGRPV